MGDSRPLLVESLLVACAVLVAYSGTRLAHYGDAIAAGTRLSRGWVGLVLVAAVTSLPELFTGGVSILAVGDPDLAVGDALGSTAFNLALVGIVGLASGARVFAAARDRATWLAGLYGVGMLSVVLVAFAVRDRVPRVVLSIAAVALVAIYLAAVAQASRFPTSTGTETAAGVPLKRAVRLYAAHATGVALAATALPFLAANFAERTGLTTSFVGTTLVAGVTSLPELVVTIAALRLGAPTLALGNLLGSNLFDLLILAIDDALYLPGPILSDIAASHAWTVLASLAMTLLALAALRRGPRAPRAATLAWIGLLAIYASLLALVARA